jgi:dTDP-4-dehydrorhamnose reductase
MDKAEPNRAFLINAEVPGTLRENCTGNRCRMIHLSTDYVFDGRSCLPYVETDSTAPQSVYAKSKRAGELEVMKNPDNIVIRTSWLYAARGANFLNTMLRLGKERESLNVVYDQIGTPTSAADLAHAILSVCDRIESGDKEAGGIYHYSNEGVCSWYDFAVEIWVWLVRSPDYLTVPFTIRHLHSLMKSTVFRLEIALEKKFGRGYSKSRKVRGKNTFLFGNCLGN